MGTHSGIREIHRPGTLEEAIGLLSRSDVSTVPLYVSARPPEGLVPAEAAVDLSRLGLDGVGSTDGGITLGATASLEALLRGGIDGTPAGVLLCEACRTTAHSGLRAAASVGGVILGGEPSDLLLALMALDAVCVLRGASPREVALADLAPRPGELLVEVRVPAPPGVWGAALERVARTPRDRSIVAAAAWLELEGDRCRAVRLAVSGLAPRAGRWPSAEEVLKGQKVTPEAIAAAAARVEAEASPTGDHLGSAEYRRAMGKVLGARALMGARQRAARMARS